MNKVLLSGTVLKTKEVQGLSGAGLHFTLQVNALDLPGEKRIPTTDISCVIVNPKSDIRSYLEKHRVIECEGKIIRLSIPAEGNTKAHRTQVVVNQRTIRQAPR
ncbi:hypothetical protein G0Q06_12960 [Puniceicoccales bacterium CK1056]|uniref:Single-stranded DNA-binding protein n=1 Tax=Oceanipulchritudo coccoides TaxID=2706888 RepID=A0A6B2M327_9BACT|nr:hypothetical protein [Oceanipulchritudo coccoides]NDV63368.1 hypothetical protein [Oceanipulchritudo coccoides]